MIRPEEHDLVVCLITGHMGTVIDIIDGEWLRINFTSGIRVVEPEDVKILKSGRQERCFVDICEKQE